MKRLIVLIYLASSILHGDSDMQEIGNHFAIDRTEASIAEFTAFAEARNFVSQAERNVGERYMLLVANNGLVGLGYNLMTQSPTKGSPQCISRIRRLRHFVNSAV